MWKAQIMVNFIMIDYLLYGPCFDVPTVFGFLLLHIHSR